MLDVLQSTGNELSFFLRNALSFSPAYQEPAESKDNLFAGRVEPWLLKQALSGLESRYDLSALSRTATRQRYLETLAYLDTLEALLEDTALPEAAHLKWLDVGAKNWSYVEAIYRFLEARTQCSGATFALDGVELDPNRRYADFHTRRSYAEAYIRHLQDTRYLPGDTLALNGRYNVISHFLPFVVKDPCLSWGLPLRFFQPQKILNHLISLLEPGGVLLIVNQGEDEARVQEGLLRNAAGDFPLEWTRLGQMPNRFLEYRYARIGWQCRKPT